MDSSGTPSLEFEDLAGKVSAQYRSGDLMISGEEGYSRLTKDHFMVATPEGHAVRRRRQVTTKERDGILDPKTTNQKVGSSSPPGAPFKFKKVRGLL